MADGIDQVAAGQREEMKLPDTCIDEVNDLLGRHRGGNEMSCGRIVVESVEAACQPRGNARSGLSGKARHLPEVVDRHDARHDGAPNTVYPRTLDEAQVV